MTNSKQQPSEYQKKRSRPENSAVTATQAGNAPTPRRRHGGDRYVHTCKKYGSGLTSAKACRGCRNRQYALWRERHPNDYERLKAKDRNGMHVRRYKMTVDDYNRMLEAQGGRCAICRSDSIGHSYRKSFSVDHCHETGTVRGLLCTPCNTGIGMFRDNPDTLHAAIRYLEAAREGKHGNI